MALANQGHADEYQSNFRCQGTTTLEPYILAKQAQWQWPATAMPTNTKVTLDANVLQRWRHAHWSNKTMAMAPVANRGHAYGYQGNFRCQGIQTDWPNETMAMANRGHADGYQGNLDAQLYRCRRHAYWPQQNYSNGQLGPC